MIRPPAGSLLCVDFQLNRLAAVEVKEGKVVNWLSDQLPAGVFRRGDPLEPKAIGAALRMSMNGAGSTASRVRFTVSDEATVTRAVRLPRLRNRELAGAMRFAAEKELRIPLDKAAWAWDVVDRTESTIEAVLVGTWRDLVTRLHETAIAAGLRLEVVEPRGMALARALQRRSAILLESAGQRISMTILLPGIAPQVTDAEADGQRPTIQELSGLVELAVRRCEQLLGPGTAPVVLVGGDLDTSGTDSLPAARASSYLNGHAPIRPSRMPAGSYLAPLGLAMREGR